MIKRNMSSILTILAMVLLLNSTDFSKLDINSEDSWESISALLIIIASIALIIFNESTGKSKH
ncbi:hypothetical protein [Flammeovirga kamogawensis]|uniref:Uncharacterized protein n=1 Tax=Flammeovirga kamogawensis TaxID=373891 RepID=A0ABX8H5S1_9BACT|nr:hypothetical protein [Flammeovirga kamogawensis]MBB6461850.1 hypothetical protein [Flammeovirga kamogawensis]QWG10535.1 hypothetical protein KM029_26545 [Flammeovirga kamogawensis]TRX63644.1 hypothetical protein EO216_24820 [Flammeovirga kamogawensis]